MTTLNDIQEFLEAKKIAIAGASRNPKKFGGAVFKELKEKGFDLYPVNPHTNEIQGVKCFKLIDNLPGDVDHLFIITSKKDTQKVAEAAVKRGVKMIWIQQQCETPEAVKLLQDAGIKLIYKKCIMMFADPVKGFHGFHRFLTRAFGKYPKMEAPSMN